MPDLLTETLSHLSNSTWDVTAHILLGIVYLIYIIISYFKDKEVKRWIIENRNHIRSLEGRASSKDPSQEIKEIDTSLKAILGYTGYFLYFIITLCYMFIAYKIYMELGHFKHLLRHSD
jgi:hypothetical protein